MTYWVQSGTWTGGVDIGILEESALAMAQSTIQNAITQSGITRSELARRMQCDRSFVTRMLTGSHNLTIKTMARSLAACGFEVRFQPVRIEWNWAVPDPPKERLPASAGSTMFTGLPADIVVPTFAL